MALARVLVGKELRSRWRGLVLLGLLAVVWAASSMTAIAGARRTSSVVDRFQRVTVASDATFVIEGDDTAAALLEALRAAPEVDAVDSLWSASTGLGFDRGLWVNLLVGTEGVWGRDFDRPIVLRGRVPTSSDPTEVTVSQAMTDLFGIDVGDHISLPTWDHDEWLAWQELRGVYPPFNGPAIDVVVVGVVERAEWLGAANEDGLAVVGTRALFDRWSADVGANNRVVAVRSDDPDFDSDSLAQRLTQRLGVPVDAFSTDESYADNLRGATHALTIGLSGLAIAVVVAGGLVLALAVSREVRRAGLLYEPLRALGATRAQRIGVLSIPIALVAVVAALIAMTLAAFASSLFPLGPGRVAEPFKGVWLDWPVLAGGSLVVVFMIAMSVLSQLRPVQLTSRHSNTVGWRPSFLHGFGAVAMVGVVNALGSRRARSSIVVAAVTIAGLTGAAWFERSMEELGNSPQRWGYTWSSSPEVGVPEAKYDSLIRALADHEGVAGVGFLDSTVVALNDEPVNLATFTHYDGDVFEPAVLAGRSPRATFEIAVGETTARQLNLDIGDTVRIDSAFADSVICTVVGIVVPPYTGTTSALGTGVYTHAVTWAEIAPPFESAVRVLVIEYEQGADASRLRSELTNLGFRFEARSLPRSPRAVANVVGVSVVVRWLLAFFLVQGLLVTLQAAARRGSASARDRRILRTLGCSSGDIRRAVSIESFIAITIALVVGMATGLIVGYRAWRLATGDLGVVDAASSVWPVVLAIAGIALVGAGGVSLAVSRAGVGREWWSQSRES